MDIVARKAPLGFVDAILLICLQVAAALADAKLCQWLIGQGLDGTLCGKLEGVPEYGTIFQIGS